jgi:YggT family protein
MDALRYVVDSLLTFAVCVFLLRVLLQFARADFRNPLSQAVLALTNWLVMPLRRVLPPIGRVDTASIVALLAVQLLATLILFRLQTGVLVPVGALLLASAIALVKLTLWFYIVLIVVYALLSFVAPGSYSPALGILSALCQPVLAPIRRVLPVIGGLDFSPLVAIVLLRAAIYLLP